MNGKEITKHLENLVKKTAIQVVEKTAKETERMARRNFNEVKSEVPSDDPLVIVSRNRLGETEQQILCIGNQVIFIEFGAGVHEQYRTKTIGLSENGLSYVENAPRPIGVVNIGGYGKGHGKDDYWFYASETGRVSSNAQFVKQNKNGRFIMLTIGIRPVRALYRAYRNAISKLLGGKLR